MPSLLEKGQLPMLRNAKWTEGKNVRLMNTTTGNAGKNHWQSVCRMSDNHNMPRQRETQRYDAKQRSTPRQRSQSHRRNRQHDNDMGIKKRIASTQLHRHQLLKHSQGCHLTVLKMKAATLLTKSSR